MRVLLLIPARGGSKSIPRKNLVNLGGKPLINWVIAAAAQSRLATTIAVSSDNHEILETASHAGIRELIPRPEHLADDEASSVDVARHALDSVALTHEIVALVQPTSPFVWAEDIDACISLCLDDNPHSSVSLVESLENPYWTYLMGETNCMTPVVNIDRPKRRQDTPATYRLNGAVFVASRKFLESHGDFIGPGTRGHLMPQDRSVDIDEPEDLERARHQVLGEIE
jgi:CMP-N,N'-diacetyllegionaminic acid synthase